ncbi:MAG: cyclase family protein [Proteocatella sp.]
MKLIALSLPITMNMVVYKNREEKKPAIENMRCFKDDGMNENTLHLPLHTGTHVDYPLHAIDGGKSSSDYDVFPAIFKGYVLDLSLDSHESIGLEHINNLDLSEVEAVFFKTRKGPMEFFDFEFPWLEKEGAAWLSRLPLKFVGIDQLGIERNQPGHETHISLLGRDILIIEGLNLSEIEEGTHNFLAITLQIKDVEAEPAMLYKIL